MQWLIDFLEKNMTKAVFVTVISSILQVFFHIQLPGQTQIPDAIMNQIMTSSSGIQSIMLVVLYLFLKSKKEG